MIKKKEIQKIYDESYEYATHEVGAKEARYYLTPFLTRVKLMVHELSIEKDAELKKLLEDMRESYAKADNPSGHALRHISKLSYLIESD